MTRKPSLFRHANVHVGIIAAVATLAILLMVAPPRIGIGADNPRPAAEAAAVSPVLSYQGRLLNPATGAPQPNGTYTFVFRIYNVDSGGTALWTETKDLIVANGLFVTLLGDTTALPTGLFTGQNLWLGIKVGADAEATPRQRLAPVAYAMYSDNADRLDGQDSPFFRNATNINAGTLAEARIDAAITRDNEVMTIVKANDGAGSGVDADLLDGQDSTAFAIASHNHDTRYYTQAQSESQYVNATGDTMSGSSANPILSVTQSGAGASGYFSSTTSYGVHGETASNANGIAGVRGTAGLPGVGITGKYGVLGQSDSGKGVTGVSLDGNGVYGWSTNTWAVRGEGQYGGIYASSWAAGSDAIRGANTAPTGSSWGVVGTSASPTGRGMAGFNSATTGVAEGVYGQSSSTGGRGVSGYSSATSGTTYGVYGENNSSGGAGVRGQGPWVGVWGAATSTSSINWGVYGQTSSTGGYAGYFSGNVQVNGSLSKSSGSFKIDHPLDPENKYLYHSFVESPDMMNVYNGNTTLDVNGEAWVDLPDYFGALNRDFRYQLTPIGGPGPNLYIASEVQNNRFQIAGGSPGLRVSWQITGIRQDAYAVANPILVEVEKPVEERGTFLHPEALGQDRSRSVDYQRIQELLAGDQNLVAPRSLDGLDKPAITPTLPQPQAIDNQ
jgi:hypothetical protein